MSLAEYDYVITEKSADLEWDANEYKILNDQSGGATFARDSSQATMVYLCEYYHFEQFVEVVMGRTRPGTSGLLVRSASSPIFDPTNGSTPEEHPFLYNFFAASATVEPKGTADNDPALDDAPVWSKAKITVVFRPVDYNVIKDDEYEGDNEIARFVSKQTTGNVEIQTTNGRFRFCTADPSAPLSGKLPLDLSPGMVVQAGRLIYTWHQIPVGKRADGEPDLARVPNLSTIMGLLGTVNSVDFDEYAPGTVLFSTWEPKLIMPSTATQDNYYFDISYTFAVRDYGSAFLEDVPFKVASEHIGWNYAWNPYTHFWDLYTTTGDTTGGTMYEYDDITQLFVYP